MNKITYLGDNQKTDFVFSFNFFQKSDIQVEINRIPQTSGYTLTCVESTKPADIPYVGGTIAFDIAPKSTDAITIYRRLKLTRVIDHQPTAKLDPETLNQDADYLMEVIKDCKDEIDELHDQYSDIADKESTSVLLAKIAELHNEIIALGNISTLRQDTTANTSNITNLKDAANFTATGLSAIANMAMPSDKYIDLTLGATGSTYTAPADGYIYINKSASNPNEWIFAVTGAYSTGVTQAAAGTNARVLMPVSKHSVITINYTLNGATNAFRFIYANGAK